MTAIVALLMACAIGSQARYIDKDIAGSRYDSKVFDYYDVAKGNVPAYLINGDKLADDYEEDREPVKIEQLTDNLRDLIKQESLSERPLASSDEIQPETLDNYEDYAESEVINKPLEVPASIDGDTESEELEPSESDSNKDKLIVDGTSNGAVETATTTGLSEQKSKIDTDKLVITVDDDTDTVDNAERAEPSEPTTTSTTTVEATNPTVDDAMVLVTVKPLCVATEKYDEEE